MQEALAKSINILKSKKFASATVVLGNISCDLDSAVCAVVYALFLQWQHSQNKSANAQSIHNAEDCEKVYIPILNVDREDYELKTEVTCWFNENGLNKNDLLFRDDMDLQELVKSTNTSVVLVDHHVPAETDRFLLCSVVQIIDHRPRDTNWTYGDNVLVNIQPVGSCASLVCEAVRAGGEFLKCFPACCNLLYGTIILDTVNFSQQVKKGTPLDMEQVLYLEAALGVRDSTLRREATLSRLVSARCDISLLSAAQLMRKDVKVSGKVLVPSFPVLVKEVLSREGAAAALREQSARSRCTAVVLLGMRLADNNLERDLAVWSERDWGEACELADKLERCSEPPLQLEQHTTEVSNCRYYRQLNLAASRKQVMPVVDSFTAGRGGSEAALQTSEL